MSADFAKMSGHGLLTWLWNFLGLIYDFRPENLKLIPYESGNTLDQKPANSLTYIQFQVLTIQAAFPCTVTSCMSDSQLLLTILRLSDP